MDMWVTEKQRFKLREHETPSQVGWGGGGEAGEVHRETAGGG